jgi:hypothetical protein
VGSEPVAGGADDWFAYWDDGFEGDPYSESEHAFLAALRARAVSSNWPCHPARTFSYHDEPGSRPLKVVVSLDDPVSHTALFRFGIVFDGKRIVGDRIDYLEPFDFDPLAAAAMEFSGPLESLEERAGAWFESLLSWPIERREWFDRHGDLVYREWVLSNIGEKLMIAAPRPRPLLRRPNRVTLVRGVRGR